MQSPTNPTYRRTTKMQRTCNLRLRPSSLLSNNPVSNQRAKNKTTDGQTFNGNLLTESDLRTYHPLEAVQNTCSNDLYRFKQTFHPFDIQRVNTSMFVNCSAMILKENVG